ncbi:MAG: LTA synthase family protein [Coriobacteriia bacterium]|nr:LTA synthase family protein [Coriobacteriia bacterium]
MLPKLHDAAQQSLRVNLLIRVVTTVLVAAFGLFLAEFAFNPGFLTTIPLDFLAKNYQILLGFLLVIYFLGQQSRVAYGVFLGICLVIGVMNHYITIFKEAPVLPSDVLAVGTAAQVSGGYDYTPDWTVIVSFALLILLVAALVLVVPKMKLTRNLVLANLALALLTGGLCAHQILDYDIKQNTGCKVDVWYVADSYKAQGTLLCFMQRAQELDVDPPQGYSDDAVRQLLGTDQKAQGENAAASGDSPSTGKTAAGKASATDKAPVVLCIMNETFTDLTLFDELAGQESAYPATYYQLAKESLLSGYTYVSAYAGGTCNSEFEFLTGMSCGNLGGGVYPYMLYSMDKTENLARWFKSQGYATTAMHPCPASNWRRDVVYQQLGFDRFVDIKDFPNAPALREKTTDKATYEKILELLEEDPSTPQFLFDITYQNHSGYGSGLVPEELQVHATINGAENDQMNEYLSVLQVADRDLGWFVDQLRDLDRPVTLCFFGDHGPNLIGDLLHFDEDVTGSEQANQIQKKYTTPYLIWTNKAAAASAQLPQLATTKAAKASIGATQHGFGGKPARTTDGVQANMSLNYLGVALAQSTGMELTPYQQFLARSYRTMPCVNLDGTLDAGGTWHWFEDTWNNPDWKVSKTLADFRIVQFGNLFGDRKQDVGFLRNVE